MSNKRIVIVTTTLEAGGLEKMVSCIGNYYSDKRWDVTIVCLMNETKEVFYELNNIDVLFFNYNSKFSNIRYTPKWIKYLRSVFVDKKPDIVLAMTLKIAALCSVAKKREPFRLVMREISDPKSKSRSRLFDLLLFRLCKKIDGIIFQTKWEKKCYPKYLQKKGEVIPNPCEVQELERTISDERIVTMGRLLNEQKRHDVLIKAFDLLKEKRPNSSLEIYGDGPDLKYDKELVEKLGLTNRVSFVNAVKDVHSRIINAGCFVLTSDYEGLSNALLEALLLGIPCISTNWPGVEDVLTDGVNGYLVKRDNPAELSEKILLLLGNSDTAQSFSLNAKSQKKVYSYKSILSKYARVIEGDKYEETV